MNLKQLLFLKAAVPSEPGEKTVIGNPVSFRTKYAEPMKLVIPFVPVQAGSGDPSPSNVRPITGWTGANVTRTGKNLVSLPSVDETVSEVRFVFNQNSGVVHVTGSTSSSYSISRVFTQRTLNKGVYTLSGCPADGSTQRYILRDRQYKNDVFVGVVSDSGTGAEIVVEDETIEHRIDIVVYSGAGNVDITFKPMLRVSSDIDSTFEPFVAYDVYPITFPSGTTVYGGTLDVTSGVLTVDRAMVDLGTLTWEGAASGTVYRTRLNNGKPGLPNSICSARKVVYPNRNNLTSDSELAPYNTADSYICGLAASYVNAAAFKADMSGI